MPRTLRRSPTDDLPDTSPATPPAGEIVFDTAFVARSLDRLIVGRLQDIETLRQMALDLSAGVNSESLHRQVVSLVRSVHEAYEGLQQSREILVGLHKQASGGAVVASVDQLTGLANRAAFAAHLAGKLDALQPAGTLSLMLIELGALKLLASEIGPAVTNRVVKRFAAILRRSIKRTDYLARLGPQHFVVLLENVLPEKAVSIALRIHDAIEAKMPTGGSSVAGVLSVTMGIAGASGPGSTADELVRKAYDAIAQARKEGRPAIYLA